MLALVNHGTSTSVIERVILEILALKIKRHHIHTFLALLVLLKSVVILYSIYIYLKFSFPSTRFPTHLNMISLHKPCNLTVVRYQSNKNSKLSLTMTYQWSITAAIWHSSHEVTSRKPRFKVFHFKSSEIRSM